MTSESYPLQNIGHQHHVSAIHIQLNLPRILEQQLMLKTAKEKKTNNTDKVVCYIYG